MILSTKSCTSNRVIILIKWYKFIPLAKNRKTIQFFQNAFKIFAIIMVRLVNIIVHRMKYQIKIEFYNTIDSIVWVWKNKYLHLVKDPHWKIFQSLYSGSVFKLKPKTKTEGLKISRPFLDQKSTWAWETIGL